MFVVFSEEPRHGLTFEKTVKELTPGFVVIALVVAINAYLSLHGMYEQFEWTDGDKLLQNARNVKPVLPVSIVSIDEEAYRDLFHSQSPLAAAPLVDIVQSICAFHPRRVGVDIFTGEWQPDEQIKAMKRIRTLSAGCNIVWIRDATYVSRGIEGTPFFRLGAVLGTGEPARGVCSALPVFVPDRDGVVRHIQKDPLTETAHGVSPYETFNKALATGECGFVVNQSDNREPVKIRFTGNNQLRIVNAKLVLEEAKESRSEFGRALGLTDSVVILGGFYRAARDQYATPIGELTGTQIIANAVSGTPISGVWWPILSFLELVTDLVLYWLLWWTRLRSFWSTIVSILVGVLLAFYISWRAFSYGGFFIGVFGSLAGIALGTVADLIFDSLKEWWANFEEPENQAAEQAQEG